MLTSQSRITGIGCTGIVVITIDRSVAAGCRIVYDRAGIGRAGIIIITVCRIARIATIWDWVKGTDCITFHNSAYINSTDITILAVGHCARV